MHVTKDIIQLKFVERSWIIVNITPKQVNTIDDLRAKEAGAFDQSG